METLVFLVLIFGTNLVLSQDNAGTSLSPSLQECYNNTLLVTRDYRLPATINTLIALIRQAEDGNPSINARLLSIQLLHRFRQDGLRRAKYIGEDFIGLPYSPTDKEATIYRMQLQKLSPGNALTFNNNSLTPLERCSLHSMISSTIDIYKRGDEDAVCNRLSRYTSRIRKRQSELTDSLEGAGISECPLESGVVDTKWGAVKAGLVLGGIAAGFNLMGITTDNGTLDNRYGSTIVGQLGQAVIYSPTTDIVIGGKGYWNSTAVPKYYFLRDIVDRKKMYVTDAEIRGGLDGLYLAHGLEKWKSQNQNLKISQILDLYYSPRGVFNKDVRACNRKILETNQTDTATLIAQTRRYSTELNKIAIAPNTPSADTINKQSTNAVNKFNDYLVTMNDLDCATEENIVERVASEILIIIDTSWNYDDLYSIISRILDNIDINKFESSYTVRSGFTGEIVVNKSRTLLDFHQNYNRTVHERLTDRVDFKKVMLIAEQSFKNKLDNSTDLTGQGTVVLLFPHSSPTVEDKEFIRNRRDSTWKFNLPDLKILVVSPNSREDFSTFVTNVNTDVINFQDNADDNLIKEVAKNVIDRLKQLPRNVVNPRCGSKYEVSEDTSFELTQYVEPSGINYHKISPNYFYAGKDERKLKIKGYSYGDVIVCMSRSEPNPGNTSGTNGDGCQVVRSGNEISYDLSCGDDSVSTCSPIYLSIQGAPSTQTRCNDKGCRFPDSIKYAILLENVRCASGGPPQFITSFSLIIFTFALISKMF